MEPRSETFLEIQATDVEFVKSFLQEKHNPVEFEELLYQVGLFKTRAARQSQVKLYDPNCEYVAGDLIFKEYQGKLPVGGKNFIELKQGIILQVEAPRHREGIEEILLAYDGTSEFRRYAEYLKKQKIELLLPHKQMQPPAPAHYLPANIDPRASQAPLIERDFSLLGKKLTTALNRESEIAFINNKILLKKNMKEIKPEIFEEIKEFLKSSPASESTDSFVQNLLKIPVEHDDFSAYCFALNYIMSTNYRINFQQTASKGWGKWHLISILYYQKKNSLISEANPLREQTTLADKKNLLQERKRIEEAVFSEGFTRHYLTQREVSAGVVRLHPNVYRLGNDIEIEAEDNTSHKKYFLYYYRDENLLLGWQNIFESYKAIQGTILVLEQTPENTFTFAIKTSKKGTIVNKISYDKARAIFLAEEEKIASPVFVNKAIFLESEVFRALENRIEDLRHSDSYNKLLHKIFIEFGSKEKNYELHILRLYHILDLIYPVDFKHVEETILSNPEFIHSEKMTGVFYLDSDAVIEIESEEKERRQKQIEEAKKKREEVRQKQIEEERKEKEDIRLLREERRRKREDEMWQAEKMRQEKEKKKLDERQQVEGKPAVRARPMRRKVAAGEAGEYSGGRQADSAAVVAEMPLEAMPGSGEAKKRPKRKFEGEKATKVAKKGQKKVLEEKIEMDEIKKQILQEDLAVPEVDKETTKKEPAKKESTKETKVAYQDEGSFGGIFASKLDEIIKKKGEEEKE